MNQCIVPQLISPESQIKLLCGKALVNAIHHFIRSTGLCSSYIESNKLLQTTYFRNHIILERHDQRSIKRLRSKGFQNNHLRKTTTLAMSWKKHFEGKQHQSELTFFAKTFWEDAPNIRLTNQ